METISPSIPVKNPESSSSQGATSQNKRSGNGLFGSLFNKNDGTTNNKKPDDKRVTNKDPEIDIPAFLRRK